MTDAQWRAHVDNRLDDLGRNDEVQSDMLRVNTTLTRSATELAQQAAADAKSAAFSADAAAETARVTHTEVERLGGKVEGVADILGQLKTIGRAMVIVANAVRTPMTIFKLVWRLALICAFLFFVATHWGEIRERSLEDVLLWAVHGSFPGKVQPPPTIER